jgi:hypothetical protein
MTGRTQSKASSHGDGLRLMSPQEQRDDRDRDGRHDRLELLGQAGAVGEVREDEPGQACVGIVSVRSRVCAKSNGTGDEVATPECGVDAAEELLPVGVKRPSMRTIFVLMVSMAARRFSFEMIMWRNCASRRSSTDTSGSSRQVITRPAWVALVRFTSQDDMP